ncbi:hypothetical protein HJD18_15160 [Thermoleophilia bacterium SCSIO 60948]|nr:hypothetical protein HJD18_15160 [Thermoleophilia bacterium SCSIO 60948]
MSAPSGARPVRSLAAVFSSFVALLALALAASPAAAAKAKPDLSVRSVDSSPRVVSPGDELTARGRVRNSGEKTGRGPVRIYLSPNADGGAEGRSFASDRVRVAPRSSERFEATGRVPARFGEYDEGSASNRYYLVACIRRRGSSGPEVCDVAERPTRVRAFSPGARSLGQPIFPQLGNGGYDVEHYDIAIVYDPGDDLADEGDGDIDQRFTEGTSTSVTATATQNLSEFSLDFQPYDVSQVLVDGEPAEFDYEDTAEFSDPSYATQFKKLVVTPPSGIRDGETFTVQIDYTGTPDEMTDADESIEGWIQACYDPGTGRICDGSFTVNEPNGTQTWAPVNNIPSDKATVDTEITVPSGKTALGAGELTEQPVDDGETTTWSWRHAVPTSPYLYSATVGDFDYTESSMTVPETGETLPVYTAIDSSGTPTQKTTITNTFNQIPTVQNYLSRNLFGAYPYGSTGGVADRTDNVFYALENASKPHYSGGNNGPSVNASTQVHELAHQWMGDSVGPATWLEIGFNEGWATWTQWEYNFVSGASALSPAVRADNYYNDPTTDWSLAPADFEDPADLFAGAQYSQTATMLQYYREIVGERRWLRFTSTIAGDYEGATIRWRQFIREAVATSEFGSARRAKLREFFRQWLYSGEKPSITADNF